MALVRAMGSTFNAKPIRQLDDGSGDWVMEALEHGTRFVPGTQVRVSQREIVQMDAPAPTASATPADIQAAMDKERETLPSVAQLIAKAPENQKAIEAALPPATATPQDKDMSASKLAGLASLAQQTVKDISTAADASQARITAARAKALGGIGMIDGVSAELEATTKAIEDMANQITNGGPSGPLSS
jgi:hypothetical protein